MGNGVAPNFNDRRGQNPFQPVVPTSLKPRSMAEQQAYHAKTLVQMRDDGTYNGRGAKGAAAYGALAPHFLNGRILPRENPDAVGLQRRLIELGEVGN